MSSQVPDHLYSHGLPFSENLSRVLKGPNSIETRMKLGKASLIIVDGALGEGKSTLAVELAEYYQGHDLDYEKQYAIGGNAFQDKLLACYDAKLPVCVYDEAGDFSGRQAMTEFNKRLNRVFETFRTFNILVIMVLPSAASLDKSIFYKGIVQMLIHCYGRRENYGNFGVYDYKRSQYVIKKIRELVVSSLAYPYTTPNFRGHFKNLPPEKSRLLDELSTSEKLSILKKANELKDYYNYQYLMKYFGIGYQAIKNLLDKHDIKPAVKEGRNVYFSKDQFDKLRNVREGIE